ncbi:MAG: HAD family phosphatase [Flavobacteriales bacterium]|nr:HAD family phosphatase [Flavobacteriales bacterium]
MRSPADFPNIIFDLGGVILNIDYHRTIHAFSLLGMKDFAATYTQLHQSATFDAFERGELSAKGFRDALRPQLRPQVTDGEIDGAWNAMLLDLPSERLRLLNLLKEQRRIFLLSNTNSIHVQAFENDIEAVHGSGALRACFERAYYSCDVGMRKPEERIFRMVVETDGLDLAQTLFIDDSPQHVEGARKAGLSAYHLMDGETILDLFGHLS